MVRGCERVRVGMCVSIGLEWEASSHKSQDQNHTRAHTQDDVRSKKEEVKEEERRQQERVGGVGGGPLLRQWGLFQALAQGRQRGGQEVGRK